MVRTKVFWAGLIVIVIASTAYIVGQIKNYDKGFNQGWQEGYSGGFEQAWIAKQGVIYTSTTPVLIDKVSTSFSSENITIKYLDSVGLVVEWEAGAVISGEDKTPITMIQRIEPWLKDETGKTYEVNWGGD